VTKWVEDTLIKHPDFALPGKNALINSDSRHDIVLMDVSESQIQRPPKSKFDVDVCYQLVIHWIKSAAEKIDPIRTKSDTPKNKVPLMELDELFSYIKKNKGSRLD
jgi:hypothetical protein